MNKVRVLFSPLVLFVLIAFVACSDTGGETEPGVVLRRTKHGVLHVVAADYRGVGVGVGYAFAEDNRCLLSHRLAEVRGRLSEFLGADAPVTAAVHNLTYTALASDHYFRGWFDLDAIRAAFAAGAPEVVEMADGYAAGINRYRAERPDEAECEVPFPEMVNRDDVFLLWVAAATVASGEVFAGSLPHAPASGSASDFPSPQPPPSRAAGSNAWALGRDAMQDGHAVHLYNPHFPWTGIHRLYMLHVTVPGSVDVFGVALGGFPLPLSGFTENVAWGLTFSPAARWAASELTLDGDGKTYLVDGEAHSISREVVSIAVRGEAQPRELPFFRADGLPVVDMPSFSLSYTADKAFAVRDINADNVRMVEQFLRLAQAGSVEGMRDELANVMGVPWSYMVAVDNKGDAFFGEITPAPRISDEQIDDCAQSSVAMQLLPYGFLILDGNRSECSWGERFEAADLPQLIRSDYVANSNNNYEWPNPHQRLSGFSRTLGGEQKALSLRASLGLKMIEQRLAGSDGLGAPGFTASLAQEVFTQARNHAAELLVDGVVEDCEQTPSGTFDNQVVDLTAVCAALKQWDRRNTVNSRGAHIFAGLWKALSQPERLFEVPANADDPLTPASGFTQDQAIRQELRDALARVALTLAQHAISPDARWGEVHYMLNDGVALAMPGGSELEGLFDVMTSTGAYYSYEGWEQSLEGVMPSTAFGATYMHVVSFDDDGPHAKGVMPYSQATEATSPWHMDQLTAWSSGAWFDFPFREEEIAADPELRETILR